MGNVSGKLEDRPSLYLRDQSRLSLVSLEVTNARKKVVARITPNSFPATGVYVKRDHGDDSLIEYIQDPDPNTPGPMLLLKLVNDGELTFRFIFNIRQREDINGNTSDTTLNGLTFIIGSSHKALENLLTREFHADPNLHKNPNVELVGDYSTGGSSAVQFEWTWKWRPPQGHEEKGNGLRTVCGFVEYDQRAHKLTTLAQFACWIQTTRSLLTPNNLSASFELKPSPKLKITPTLLESAEEDKNNELEPPSPFDIPFDTSYLTNAMPSVKVDCQRPAESLIAEDGPLFRATIKSLEQKTGALRARMKKVLKQAEKAKLAQVACNESLQLFMESLREAASSNATGIQPALDHYYERTFRAILSFEKQNEVSLQRLIIEPLTKLYNVDIKQAEAKRKEFEEESRDYYNYVGRYLGIRNNDLKQKKKVESDSKYQIKRRNFELKRFDYCSFMEDLHGGRKEQEILSQLTKFADAQAKSYLATATKVQELMPQLEALNFEVKETDKEFQLQRTEREERRRQLETSQKAYVEPDSVPFVHSQVASGRDQPGSEAAPRESAPSIRTVSAGVGADSTSSSAAGGTVSHHPISPPSLGGFGSPNNRFKGIRDLQENEYRSPAADDSEADRKKEGLLWALSRPGSHVDPKGLNKQAWHKYWVVVAGGQLCEYSNWKQKLDLHNEPINLRMASVREARSSDRRFCFEIITPQYKRVYQATSEEDMNNWISAINNAMKSTIEGGKSVIAFDQSRIENAAGQPMKSIQSALTGKSHHNPLSILQSSIPSTTSNNSSGSSLYRRTTVGARPNASRRTSNTIADDPEKLLQLLREADPSNLQCADCGSQVKVEWVSINLGIILCIECSGLHRSLGTHVSKIRSLTLDTVSFTPDMVELLCHLGNKISNAVWEATVNIDHRPDARATRELRLKYITQKYVDRAFVEAMSTTLSPYSSPNEQLIDAVRRGDFFLALQAIALRADPNVFDPRTCQSVVQLALSLSDRVPPSPTSPTAVFHDHSTTSSPVNPTFPMAEFLIQNGGDIPEDNTSLSMQARVYLQQKVAKRLGLNSLNTSNSTVTSNSNRDTQPLSNQDQSSPPSTRSRYPQSSTTSPQERKEKEKERLAKRVSSGSRLMRAPPLDKP